MVKVRLQIEPTSADRSTGRGVPHLAAWSRWTVRHRGYREFARLWAWHTLHWSIGCIVPWPSNPSKPLPSLDIAWLLESAKCCGINPVQCSPTLLDNCTFLSLLDSTWQHNQVMQPWNNCLNKPFTPFLFPERLWHPLEFFFEPILTPSASSICPISHMALPHCMHVLQSFRQSFLQQSCKGIIHSFTKRSSMIPCSAKYMELSCLSLFQIAQSIFHNLSGNEKHCTRKVCDLFAWNMHAHLQNRL